ncbi:hypothetical protein ACPCKW_18800 [Streptomyces griseoincarnatus]
MSRWNGPLARRRGATSSRTRRQRPAADPAGRNPENPPGQAPRVLVERHASLLLLSLPTDDTLHPADIADLARTMGAQKDGTVTIVAIAVGETTVSLWPRLSETLDSLRDEGTSSVRLVMSGAGADRPGRPAPARRIAEAWKMTVEAPDGPVLVVPGGSVFVPPGRGGWRRFAPGEEPEDLGPRTPAPAWQTAVSRAPARTADGCVVDQIPAGLVIRPAEANAPHPGDLFHAIPVDPGHAAVVVGVPWGEDVVANDVAEVLAALPAVVRRGVRLAPGGRRDLLPLGQSVAAQLDSEIEVTTGLPLIAADKALGRFAVRSVLAGPDGEPRWVPFVDAVLCLPPKESVAQEPELSEGEEPARPRPVMAPPPRLLRWSAPAPELGLTQDGVARLSDAWHVVATRAGLWVGPPGITPPLTARPVSAEGPVVEVGRGGDRLDPSLWPLLSGFLGRLTPDIRARTTLHVHATAPDGGYALRRLTAEHGLRVISFAPAPAARPARRDPAPEGIPGPRPPAPASRPASNGVTPTPTGGPEPAPGTRPAPVAPTAPAKPQGTSASSAGETAAPDPVPAAVSSLAAAERGEPSAGPVAGKRPAPVASLAPATPQGASSTPAREAPAPAPDPAPAAAPTALSTSSAPEAAAPREPSPGPDGPSATPTAGAPATPAPVPAPEPPVRTVVRLASGSTTAEGAATPAAARTGTETGTPDSSTAVTESTAPESAAPPDPSPDVPRRKPDDATATSGSPGPQAPAPPPAPRPASVSSAAPSARTAPSRPVPTSGSAPVSAATPPAPAKPAEPAAGRAAGETRTAPAPRREPAAAPRRRPLPPVAVEPQHSSTPSERAAFRTLAKPVWERHSAAVNRALAEMPALRGAEQEAARVDLVALRMYLTNTEGPLDHRELAESLRSGERRLVPYAGCVASALARLPSYRGVVLRGRGDAAGLGDMAPGDVLRDPAPVSGLPLEPVGKRPVAGVGCVIWSTTGRRVRRLMDGGEEIVFAPGTAYRVLDVRTDHGAPMVLLRQVRSAESGSVLLEDGDETALERLNNALAGRTAPGAGDWADRCAGPFGGIGAS